MKNNENEEQNNQDELGEFENKESLENQPGESKEKEYIVLWDKYVRLCADFENTRKRWERERSEVIRFANFSLLQDLIVMVDELEQALKMVQHHSNIDEIEKGFKMICSNFKAMLQRKGLKEIEAKGKKFDPHLHEIIASKEVEDSQEEHIVLEDVQKGYLFEDKVLRTAKVIIGVKNIVGG